MSRLNLDFYNPARILFGKDRIADLATAIPAEARVCWFDTAAAVCFDGDPSATLEKRGRNIGKALSFDTILTLPATGSEMNSGSIITRKSR